MTNKFKVGDKVKVVKTNPEWCYYVPELEALIGQTFEVVLVDIEDISYKLDTWNNGINWIQEDCLELIQDEPQKQMVALEDVLELLHQKFKNAIKLLQENNYEVTKKSS